MADFCTIHDLARLAPTLLTGVLRGFVQAQDPFDKYEREFGDPTAGVSADDFSVPIGALIVGTILSLIFQVMFGFWGKSAAEEQGIHPAIGFAMGFFFYWMGVKMIPLFRKDRVLNKARYQPPLQQPNAPNPMYAPPGGYPQASAPNPMYAPPGGYAPPAPPAPPPPPQPQMLVADEGGYVMCPGCAARTKSGRKTCMNCGYVLPAVYDPNIK